MNAEEDLVAWRLEELEKARDALEGALRAQATAMAYNREQEVTEHTAIRREIADGLDEVNGRLWSAAAAVIVAVIAAAVGQGLIG